MRGSLSGFLGAMQYAAPALYIAGALVVWLTFSRTNPDGLANVLVALYTFPIVAIGTFLLQGEFPYVPGSYYVAHALYFWPSVFILALAMFLVFRALRKIVQRAVPGDAQRIARQ